MTDSFQDRLRVTAERLRSERQRLEIEKAETLARQKAHADSLYRYAQHWQQKILPRIVAAVETANHIVEDVQIKCAPGKEALPRQLRSISKLELPSVTVTQHFPPPPSSPSPRLAAARRVQQKIPIPANNQSEPLLKLAIDIQGNVAVEKKNYKFGNIPSFPLVGFEQFQEESVEELIAEFVNSGLLGYDPDTPEPKNQREAEGIPPSQTPPEVPTEPSGSSADRHERAPAPSGSQVIAAIRSNQATIKLTSESLIALVDKRIEDLSGQIPNSDEARTAWERELQTHRDMRDKTQSLIAAIESLLADATKETGAIDATLSFAGGLRKWWTESHSEICERGFDSGLFALGVMICHYAGAGGDMAAVISATVVKGKPIIEALKAWVGGKGESSKGEGSKN